MGSNLSLGLADPETYASGVPWDLYARMRAEEPVHWTPAEEFEQGFWSLFRYEDIVDVNKDWERFSSARRGAQVKDGGILPVEVSNLVFNMMDPPDHDRHRGILQKVFTAKAVSERVPDIRATINRLIDEVIERGECDFVRDLAVELPLTVTANLLGVPWEDREKLFEWTNAMADSSLPAEEKMAMLAELGGYLPSLVASRREHPTDDLLSRLVHAELDGESLSDVEIMFHFAQLMAGGNETTRNAYAGGVLALIEHPDEMRVLREDPSLIPNAVEEILRWHTPILHQARTVTRDLELGGRDVAEDDKVVLWYGSANRDPALNEDPDRFSVRRARPKHMSFGAGRHFCLGNQLARLELAICLEETLRRMHGIELAGPVEKKPSVDFHWMVAMPVTFAPAAREVPDRA